MRCRAASRRSRSARTATRALVANSTAFGDGRLLYALEAAHNDGPWDNPEKFDRLNGVLRYSVGQAGDRSTITAMGYSAGWNSTDQIPQRAVDAGLIGRYGAVDPTDGGQTQRSSLSLHTEHTLDGGSWRLDAYAIRSKLDLYSDFTYFLEHPSDLDPTQIAGDQFHQTERRQVYGLATSRAWNTKLGGHDSLNTLGLQVRHDRLDPVGLYSTVARQTESTTQVSRVRETSVGLYAENQLEWSSWLRSVTGVRADRFFFDVKSSIAPNGGNKSAGPVSPKLGLIFGPWAKTEVFVDYGQGFHSDDARGVTATVRPKQFTADPNDPNAATSPSRGLVRSKGGEPGLRTEVVRGLQTSVARWPLKLGSELVFSGDAGDTQASRPSKRYGVELNNHYAVTPWLLLDADVAISHAQFTIDDPATPGRYIPGSVDKVVSLGATVLDRGPWFGHFQLRYFGPRPLIEDDSQRSKSTTLAYVRIGYKLRPSVKLALDAFNLFDRKASDIDYYYASRLKGEPAEGVNDIHFHPIEPRRVRLTLSANF